MQMRLELLLRRHGKNSTKTRHCWNEKVPVQRKQAEQATGGNRSTLCSVHKITENLVFHTSPTHTVTSFERESCPFPFLLFIYILFRGVISTGYQIFLHDLSSFLIPSDSFERTPIHFHVPRNEMKITK